MNARFQDLNFYALDDDSIRLEQVGYAGEIAVIDAHPEQLLFIARRICGMKPETANQVADLKRRISVLTDKLQHLVCDSSFRTELLDGLETGFEYIAKLDGMLDLALEFDGGRLTPEEPRRSPLQAGNSGEEVRPVRQPASVSKEGGQQPIIEPTNNTDAATDSLQLF